MKDGGSAEPRPGSAEPRPGSAEPRPGSAEPAPGSAGPMVRGAMLRKSGALGLLSGSPAPSTLVAVVLVLALAFTAWGCGTSAEAGDAAPAAQSDASGSTAEAPAPASTGDAQIPTTTSTSYVPSAIDGGVADTDLQRLMAGNEAFAVDLFLAVRDTTRGNLVFSPYSISTATAMLTAGTAGETQAEIVDALHFPLDQDVLHAAFHQLGLDLAKRPEDARQTKGVDQGKDVLSLFAAQGAFGSPDIEWKQSFRDLLEGDYGAPLAIVDFSEAERARALINQWVAERTEDGVPEVLPPGSINPNGLPTELALVSTLYLKACWEYPFSGSSPGEFRLLDGSTVSVDTMRQSMLFPSAEGDGWRALEFPYKGKKLSFVAIVPDAGEFEAFASGLTVDTLRSILSDLDADGRDPDEINVSLPKFAFNSALRLKEPFQALGVKAAFRMGAADLSPMGAPKGGVWVDDVYHGARIAVDERGTEASAATVWVGVAGITDRDFFVDRPFLFLIRDRVTGAILFLGQVVDPRAG